MANRVHVENQGNRLVVTSTQEVLEKSFPDQSALLQEAEVLGWMQEGGTTDGRSQREIRKHLGSFQEVDLDELKVRGFLARK